MPFEAPAHLDLDPKLERHLDATDVNAWIERLRTLFSEERQPGGANTLKRLMRWGLLGIAGGLVMPGALIGSCR